MSWYDLARFAISSVFPLFHPLEVTGKENYPETGSFIICSNHINFRDPLMIAWSCKRDVSFIAKAELFRIWPMGWLLKKLTCIPVDRGANDMSTIRSSLAVLKEGNVLGIFPEGHRYTDGKMHEFQTGIGLLVTRSKAPVVPIKISGSYRLFHKVRLHIGKPFTYEMVPGMNGSEQLKACTQQIYDRISEL